MSGARIRVKGSPVTHVVSWSFDTYGSTRCGMSFAWDPNGPNPVVDCDCDCMTCLVKEDRTVSFPTFEVVGVSVINAAAIAKLYYEEE